MKTLLSPFKPLKIWICCLAVWLLCPGLPLLADEAKGGYNGTTREYQVKFRVPAELADTLWQFLQRHYSTTGLKKINPRFSSEPATETYLDVYYDDAAYTLLRHHHSLRHRMIIAGRGVDRQFVQLKISNRPRARHQRREIKFNLNQRPDKQADYADHPFWRLIRPADRRQVRAALRQVKTPGDHLRPVMELQQLRRRLYLRNQGSEWLYFSLDEVRTNDPEATFTELELALNENAFTSATPAQRSNMIRLLDLLQLDLTNNFGGLILAPLPKYNKMYNLHHGHRIRPRFYNLAWLGIGLVLTGIAFYLYRTRNRVDPGPVEMF